MSKLLAMIYGLACYVVFLVAFLYAIAFTGNIRIEGLTEKTIDYGGVQASIGEAIIINVLLLGLFAVQHSVMARPGFKRVWTKIVPKPVERSTYVLVASLILLLLYWQWRPMPEAIWALESGIGYYILTALFWVGWVVVLASTFMIDHFELFGLRQVAENMQGKPLSSPRFKTAALYRLVRHPIMLGFIIAFWSAPVMSQGHLLFAVMTTGYILIALQLEERDLIAHLGDKYRDYRKRVRMLIPIPRK